MINISHLSYCYPQKAEPVFDNISLSIQPNTLTLVAGASGVGKSTFLRCINGLVPHFTGGTIGGSINVFGANPTIQGPEVVSELIGFVFQEPEAQFVFETVEDEIAFALENLGLSREEMHSRVASILNKLDLSALRHRKIHDLSGGEKQKIAIASALVLAPKVIILDEPTSQLDPISANEILQLIVQLKQEHHLTVLISEHRLERLLPYTESILYLTPEPGWQFGTPQEILTEMEQVPPIITIAKRFKLTPLPLSLQEFPPNMLAQETTKSQSQEEPNLQMSPDAVIHLEDISVDIQGNKILQNVSLDFHKGEILALMGPNGAGKTTLLRAILGLIPSKGSRFLHHEDMSQLSISDIIQHVGYLPQNPNDLLFSETVREELAVTLRNHGLQEDPLSIVSLLNMLGLGEKMNAYPRDLSVGERQRVALASITIHDPEIIFLDEPTRGMDYGAKLDLSSILKVWRDQGKSIMLITHDVEFASIFADRIAILEEGKFLFSGSPQVALTHFPAYRTQTAALFPGTNWITPLDIPESVHPF